MEGDGQRRVAILLLLLLLLCSGLAGLPADRHGGRQAGKTGISDGTGEKNAAVGVW